MSEVFLGISEGFHDAGATVIKNGNIISATHAERFSRIKNDKWIHRQQHIRFADTIAFYEKSWLKRTRQLYAGQGWKKLQITPHDVSFYHHPLPHPFRQIFRLHPFRWIFHPYPFRRIFRFHPFRWVYL